MLKIDYKFKDESLLRLAMTHSSYANEHHGTHLQCNERLEFLGDSVLGFVTAGCRFVRQRAQLIIFFYIEPIPALFRLFRR